MNMHTIFLSSALLMLTLSANATPDNAKEDTTETIQPERTTVSTCANPRYMLEKLHFHLQELDTVLTHQPHNMTMIKTETSWIRKNLTDLHDWSVKLSLDKNAQPLPDKFLIITNSMVEEVDRDDMLDDVELQSLQTNYKHIEKIITEYERKQ